MVGQPLHVLAEAGHRPLGVRRAVPEAGPVHGDEPHAQASGEAVVGVAGQARVRGAVHVDDRVAVRRADVVGGQGAPVGQRQLGRGSLHRGQRRKMAAVIPVVTPEEMAAIDRAARSRSRC